MFPSILFVRSHYNLTKLTERRCPCIIPNSSKILSITLIHATQQDVIRDIGIFQIIMLWATIS